MILSLNIEETNRQHYNMIKAQCLLKMNKIEEAEMISKAIKGVEFSSLITIEAALYKGTSNLGTFSI